MYKDNRYLRSRKPLKPSDCAIYMRLAERLTPRVTRAKQIFDRMRSEEEKKRKKTYSDKSFELVLVRRAQDRRVDAETRALLKELLLLINLPLVFSLAQYACANYGNFRIPYDDYFSAACSAFHDAIIRYDFNKGEARLGNYAIFLVRDQIRKMVCVMSPTASISNLYFTEHKKRCAGQEYKAHVLERSENLIFAAENGEMFGPDKENFDSAASVDVPFTADEETLDRRFEAEEARNVIERALGVLSDAERDAVCRAYGICGRDKETSPEARKRLRMNGREYMELVSAALNKMKGAISPEERANVL